MRERHLGLADQVGQRRAEIVGQVGGKLRQPREAVLQPREHGIERGQQVGQLARRALQRQARIQLAGDHGSRLPPDAREPLQSAAHQPQAQQRHRGHARDDRQEDMPPVARHQRGAAVAVLGHQHRHRIAVIAEPGLRGDRARCNAGARPPRMQGRFRCQHVGRHRCRRGDRLALGVGLHQRAAVRPDDAQDQSLVARHHLGIATCVAHDVIDGLRVLGAVAQLHDLAEQHGVVGGAQLGVERVVQIGAGTGQHDAGDQDERQHQPCGEGRGPAHHRATVSST